MGEYAGDTGLMARPDPARRVNRAVPVLVTVVVLAALVGAGVGVVRRSGHQPVAYPGTAAPVGGVAATSTPPTRATPNTPTTIPSPPSTTQVQIAGALRDNIYADQVVALFSRYFNAINRRDYQLWLGALSVDHAPDPKDKFLRDYHTTTDENVRIVDIVNAGDSGLLVSLSFRSYQEPSLAPTDAPYLCLDWEIQYPVVVEDGVLKISYIRPVHYYRKCV
jgi:hypothetical protein